MNEIQTETLSIESIPLPLAGIMFSDSIHSIVLNQYQLGAGIVLFEKSPEEYFINSCVGLKPLKDSEKKLFSSICTEISQNITGLNGGEKFQMVGGNYAEFLKFIMANTFLSFKVFRINDYLNSSGYWFLFSKDPKVFDSEENLDLLPDPNQLMEGIRETIENQISKTNLEDIIARWVKLLDLRDKETEAHTRRVAGIAENLAMALGLSAEQVRNIKLGALLHDIGKLVIPNNILNKKDSLTDEEWKIMRLHPSIAIELLSSHSLPQEILDIPIFHHERWSGNGYPYRLKGEDIPLAARIFAVVDVWDALRSDRPYRKKLGTKKIKQYLESKKGIDFDPEVVNCFMSLKGAFNNSGPNIWSSSQENRLSY